MSNTPFASSDTEGGPFAPPSGSAHEQLKLAGVKERPPIDILKDQLKAHVAEADAKVAALEAVVEQQQKLLTQLTERVSDLSDRVTYEHKFKDELVAFANDLNRLKEKIDRLRGTKPEDD
ncbi:MAG: hypothetical protein VXW22_11730 [Pseudomonadota bacterium]|nr:hypothetical protein [Pseudomonadota bacterium]